MFAVHVFFQGRVLARLIRIGCGSGEDPFELHRAADYLQGLAEGTLPMKPLLPIGGC